MSAPSSPQLAERVLRGIGLVVWAVVGSPTLWRLARASSLELRDLAWAALYVAFAVLFWRATAGARRPSAAIAELAAEAVVAVALAVLGMPHFEGALLAVVSVQAATLLGPRGAIAWSAAQALPLFWLVLPTHGPEGALKATGEYLVFALFAISLAHLRRREARAREALAREHAALLAAQSQLAEHAKTEERLRIARDVHDAIGHHLTAASLHLQLAARTQSADSILAAQGAVKQTLGELRELVGAIKSDREIDLRAALETLCKGVAGSEIHLSIQGELVAPTEGAAHALFRCAQEGLTNAVKHAAAKNVWVVLEHDDATTTLSVRDDGRGQDTLLPGHGLEGMRARMRELGGDLSITTSPGKGLTLRAWVPGGALT